MGYIWINTLKGTIMKQEDFIEKQEKDKFKFIKKNFEQSILYIRFNDFKDFLNHIESFGLEHSWDEQSIKNNEAEAIENYALDYSITVGINKNWGYIDIYYLYDLHKNILVTEVNISDE